MKQILEQIMFDCKSTKYKNCLDCKWYNQEEKECIFFDAPEYWDLEEILKRGAENNE